MLNFILIELRELKFNDFNRSVHSPSSLHPEQAEQREIIELFNL